jgi:PAS domain S-box-containing protein
MKSNTKVLIGFLLVIILILAQGVIAYKLQGDIIDNTNQIRNIEAPLELMSEQVIGYDAMLTEQIHVTLLHALKGKYTDIKEHKEKYDEIETKLDDVLKRDAAILLQQSKRSQEIKNQVGGYLKTLDELNIKLAELERGAFESIEKNDTETAYSLVVGEDYNNYKNEFYQNYRDWADAEHEVTLNMNKKIIKESQQISSLCFGISILVIITVILTMLMIRSFIKGREKELDIREKMEQKYRILFENATDAIFIADAKTRQLVDCNKAAEELMGYSRDKILSMRADELHPKDKIKETMEGFKKQIEGKIKSVLTEVLAKNNKRIPVKINASAIKIGDKIYNQGIFRKLK